MRQFFGLVACLLLIGCGPGVSKDDLGTILEEVPEVPGAEQAFEMPQFDQHPAGDAEVNVEAGTNADSPVTPPPS